MRESDLLNQSLTAPAVLPQLETNQAVLNSLPCLNLFAIRCEAYCSSLRTSSPISLNRAAVIAVSMSPNRREMSESSRYVIVTLNAESTSLGIVAGCDAPWKVLKLMFSVKINFITSLSYCKAGTVLFFNQD